MSTLYEIYLIKFSNIYITVWILRNSKLKKMTLVNFYWYGTVNCMHNFFCMYLKSKIIYCNCHKWLRLL